MFSPRVQPKKVISSWSKCFSNNILKTNADKCHLILSNEEPFSINIDKVIKSSHDKKLFGINLDNILGFDNDVRNICARVSKKLHALARTRI